MALNRSVPAFSLLSKAELRLALVAGLVNGFGSITGLPFFYYAPLAVLAVGAGSFGGSLTLGRQRLLGTVLGSLVLVVGQAGLVQLPLPVALAITLGLLRLIGGALGFRAGYKVGGLIVVMGWLVHARQLDSWLPLRLLWTVVGVLAMLLALRVLWPARAVDASRERVRCALEPLAQTLRAQADGIACDGARMQHLRSLLVALRELKPQVLEELGLRSRDHPYFRWIEQLEQGLSLLLRALDGRRRRPAAAREHDPLGVVLQELHDAEQALLVSVAERLQLWARCCSSSRGGRVPPLPGVPWAAPSAWQNLQQHVSAPGLEAVPLERLQRLAGRLMLGAQMERAISTTESGWMALCEQDF